MSVFDQPCLCFIQVYYIQLVYVATLRDYLIASQSSYI